MCLILSVEPGRRVIGLRSTGRQDFYVQLNKEAGLANLFRSSLQAISMGGEKVTVEIFCTLSAFTL